MSSETRERERPSTLLRAYSIVRRDSFRRSSRRLAYSRGHVAPLSGTLEAVACVIYCRANEPPRNREYTILYSFARGTPVPIFVARLPSRPSRAEKRDTARSLNKPADYSSKRNATYFRTAVCTYFVRVDRLIKV